MKLKIFGFYYFLLCAFLFSSYEVHANTEGEKLVSGCNELMGMYKNRSEQRFLASQMTSSSDSLLAGFCLGATKAYMDTHFSSCRHNDWYELAESVAGMWSLNDSSGSVSSLLKQACSN